MTWKLIDSWTYDGHSTPVLFRDFKNLASYNDVHVLLRQLTSSAAGARRLQVSIDNGVTFLGGTGSTLEYTDISTNNGESNVSNIALHQGSGTAARTCNAEINMFSMTGTPKVVQSLTINGTRTTIINTLSPLNAVRVLDTGFFEGFNGGSIYLYAR